MGYIELKKLWTDDDGMLQVEVEASNGDQIGKQDFYVYPEDLEEFGKNLISFPSSISDTVTFEYGKKDNYYSHVVLSAMLLGSTGPACIKVQLDNLAEPPGDAYSRFYISAEAASINAFGKSLVDWSKKNEDALRAEFIV